MTSNKKIIGLSVSVVVIIVFGLIIGLVIVPSLTKKEESTQTSTQTSTTPSTQPGLQHQSDTMTAMLILNDKKEWTQSNIPFVIKNENNETFTPEECIDKFTKKMRIRIGGIYYDIKEIKMTIGKTQIVLS